MRKDGPTVTRYFVLLLLIFVAWLFVINDIKDDRNFKILFDIHDSSL